VGEIRRLTDQGNIGGTRMEKRRRPCAPKDDGLVRALLLALNYFKLIYRPPLVVPPEVPPLVPPDVPPVVPERVAPPEVVPEVPAPEVVPGGTVVVPEVAPAVPGRVPVMPL
jgi:hypothetical protein